MLAEGSEQRIPSRAEKRADELDVLLQVAAAEELVHGRLWEQRRSDVGRSRRRLHCACEPLRQDEVADADAGRDGLRERAREGDVLPAVQLEKRRRRFALEPDRPVRIVLDEPGRAGLADEVRALLGDRPALDVEVEFDKPLTGLGGSREINRLALFSRLRFLAPGREIRTLLDSGAAYFARKEPTLLTVTVSYRTPAGETHRHAITHDLTIYRDLA
jgi:hypothetical protein